MLDGLEGGGDGDDLERLSKLGRLGAQLVFQRAIEEEVERFLGRARFQRTPEARGSRNGHRPRQIATAEGPLTIAVPQVRDSLTRFVSSVIPDCRSVIRTRPLEALIIGAYVRGLSDRDIESLAAEAGLGHISRTAVSSCEFSGMRICAIITSNTPTTKSCPRCLRAKAMPYYHP